MIYRFDDLKNTHKRFVIPARDTALFLDKFNAIPDPHGHFRDFFKKIGESYWGPFDHFQTFKKKNHIGRYGRIFTCSIYGDIDQCKEWFKGYFSRIEKDWEILLFRAIDVNVYFSGLYNEEFGDPLEYDKKYRERDFHNKTTIVFIEKDKKSNKHDNTAVRNFRTIQSW